MVEFSWWEYNGKKKKPPRNLVYRKNGRSLDLRFRVSRDFINDKKWVHRDIITETYRDKVLEHITEPPMSRKFDRGTLIKFIRYHHDEQTQ